jgi:hypothetical protein
MRAKRKNVRELTERRCPNEERARGCLSYGGEFRSGQVNYWSRWCSPIYAVPVPVDSEPFKWLLRLGC